MGLEVFIAHKTVTISVELSKDLERAWLARAERRVFDLRQEASQTSGGWLVIDVVCGLCRLASCKVLINESWWRVRALVRGKSDH